MAYFVVERSKEDGTLRIPLPDAYETREAAIAALSSATATGAVTLEGEVFIADLGAAVPVLVMQTASAPVPSEAPTEVVVAADIAPAAEDVAGEPVELAEDEAIDAFSSWEPLEEVVSSDSTLADALKRAATSLEGEGIVAPDSVLSADDVEAFAAADESLAQEAEVATEEADSEVVLAEAPLESQEPNAEGSAWPWANVESYEIQVDVESALEEAEEIAAEAPEAGQDEQAEVLETDDGAAQVDELLAEEAPIITSAPPEGEEVYVPHPVILGDYADALPESEGAALVEMESEVLTTDEDEIEPLEIDEPGDDVSAIGEPHVDSALVVDRLLEELEAPAPDEDASEAGEPAEPEPTIDEADSTAAVPEVGYEATGELKLDEYTCQDCVYANTCPKVGQTTPAECGSFQWRSG